MMTKIWVFIIAAAFLIGGLSGRMKLVSSAAVEGSRGAVELFLAILGVICLWSGLMEVMTRSGLNSKIAGLLRPVLKKLFGRVANDDEAMGAVSANMTANLLGLANAATPLGLKAATRIDKLTGGKTASDELITLIVINSASIQLIPATVAAVRASLGAQQPYDILPAVWVSSALSVTAALIAKAFFRRIWEKKEKRR